MGLLQPEQAEEPELSTDEEVDLAAKELGEPLAIYRGGGRYMKLKVILGVALLMYGLIANYFWWVHGPARFGHIEFHLLIAPPVIGGGLLAFLYRNRGLRVLIFPTGLLRLKPNEVESFPWETIVAVHLKTDTREPIIEYTDTGEIAQCWLPVSVPLVQVWNSWFEIERSDLKKSRFTPAVADYPELARQVQCGTFAVLWPKLLTNWHNGESTTLGDLTVSREGIQFANKALAWSEIKEVSLAHKILSLKKVGSWRGWWAKEISQIPNPHLLMAVFELAGVKKKGDLEDEEPAAETTE